MSIWELCIFTSSIFFYMNVIPISGAQNVASHLPSEFMELFISAMRSNCLPARISVVIFPYTVV